MASRRRNLAPVCYHGSEPGDRGQDAPVFLNESFRADSIQASPTSKICKPPAFRDVVAGHGRGVLQRPSGAPRRHVSLGHRAGGLRAAFIKDIRGGRA